MSSSPLDPHLSYLANQLVGVAMKYERCRPQLAARIDARIERVVSEMLATAILASHSSGRTPRAIMEEAKSSVACPASNEARAVQDQIYDEALLAPAYPYFDAALAVLDMESADESVKSQARARYAEAATELRAWMIARLARPLLERWVKENADDSLYDLACFE